MNVIGLLGFKLMYIPESIKYRLEQGTAQHEKQAKADIEYLLTYNKASEQ
jgi:hypothetical protein